MAWQRSIYVQSSGGSLINGEVIQTLQRPMQPQCMAKYCRGKTCTYWEGGDTGRTEVGNKGEGGVLSFITPSSLPSFLPSVFLLHFFSRLLGCGCFQALFSRTEKSHPNRLEGIMPTNSLWQHMVPFSVF